MTDCETRVANTAGCRRRTVCAGQRQAADPRVVVLLVREAMRVVLDHALISGAAVALTCYTAYRVWRREADASSNEVLRLRTVGRVVELEEQLRQQAQVYEATIAQLKRIGDGEDAPKKEPLYRVVLTGGPCGGKTTALSEIKARLEALGFLVLCIPEAATMLFGGGCPFPHDETSGFVFQKNLLKLQIALEEAFTELGEASGRKCMMLFDRGLMDGKAYMSASQARRARARESDRQRERARACAAL
eukprot:3733654-Prymnesium_polylepis.1